MAGAVMFSAVMVGLTKGISPSIPGEQSVVFRFLVGLSVCGVVFASGLKRPKPVNVKLLVTRGVLGAVATISFFVAIASTERLADVTALCYTFPAFAAVFSHFFIGERLSRAMTLTLAVTFGGMCLICKPGFDSINVGEWAAITSALFSGGAVVAIRKLRETDSSWNIFFSLCLFGFLIGLPFAAAKYHPPTPLQWRVMLLIGLLATASQMLMTYSFKYCKATEGSIIMMMQIVASLAVGYFFFAELPDRLSLVGGMMILGGGAYIIARQPEPGVR